MSNDCNSCTTSKTKKNSTGSSLFSALLVVVIPKCPICIMAYTSAVTMCGGPDMYMAEIIKEKRAITETMEEMELKEASTELTHDLYINPVCKIPVQKSTAKHVVDYEGENVYFCCDGCKESFDKEPAAYMN